jgi:hypothetical protein
MCFVGCTKGLEEKISSLETEKSTFQEKISTLETEKSKLTDVKSGLNQQLEVAKEENKTLQDQVQQLTSQLAESKNKFKQTDHSLKESQDKLKESELELAKLQGKWEALEQEKERAAKEVASKASLVVQLGVRMQSGDTLPVKGTKVYLAKESFYSIAGRNMTYVHGGGKTKTDRTQVLWGGGLGQFSILFGSAAQKISSKVQSKAKFISSTDFLGKVEFGDIPKGEYYLICGTGLGQGFGVVWSEKIQLKSGKNTFSFDQSDGLSP